MFRSIRIRGAKLTLFSLICFVIFLIVCLLMLRAGAPDSVTVNGERVGLKVNSDEDIEAFLKKCGCTVEGCVSDDEVTVPKTWNEVYERYNELQRQQGFDLRPYKGKTARKLVYALSDSTDYATVLICEGRIVAADLSTMRQGDDPRPLIPS